MRLLERLERLLGKERGPITGYKSIQEDMTSANGVQKWTVGDWYKQDGPLELCKGGFHASKYLFSLYSGGYVYGDKLFKVEARGNVVEDGDEFAASEMRLVKEIDLKRLSVDYATRCARRVLDRYEVKHLDDNRPRSAIEAAEKWLKDPTEENRLAAWPAALSVAWSAAEYAALSVAWSAAGSAARSASFAAEYAAWSAARYAARSASFAAEHAAWSAAGSAAEHAAWSAAEYAAGSAAERSERKWQKDLLEGLVEKYYLNEPSKRTAISDKPQKD